MRVDSFFWVACVITTASFGFDQPFHPTDQPWRLPIDRPVERVPTRDRLHALGAERLEQLATGQPIRRFVVGQGYVAGETAEATGTEIYRNTQGMLCYPPGANVPVADDIQTIAAYGSDMTFLEISVSGGGDGAGPGFSVQFQLYDGCPQGGGVPIPGTMGQADLPDDGAFLVSLDLEVMPVSIPGSFWLRVVFSTNSACWMIAEHAEIGHSNDLFDGPFPCFSHFGGQAAHPQASFYADVFATNFQNSFVAYRADAFSGYFVSMELSDLFADDIYPSTHLFDLPCAVVGYQPVFAGLQGPYEMLTEVWTADSEQFRPLVPVPGTQCGTSIPCFFDPPIAIPTASFFVVYDLVHGSVAGPVLVSDYPSLGTSGDVFCSWDGEAWGCTWFFGGCGPGSPFTCATFRNTIWCTGPEPAGACCIPDSPDGVPCHDAVPFSQCTGRFAYAATCADNPFDPPCPLSACCISGELCANLTQNNCELMHGLWQPGRFCHIGDQECPPDACISSANDCAIPNDLAPGCNDPVCCAMVCEVDIFCCEAGWDSSCVEIAELVCDAEGPENCGANAGDCCAAHDAPGCNDPACCEAVCTCDPYCCETMWDESCAGTGFVGSCGAATLCPNQPCYVPPAVCPSGSIHFIEPPSGVVDARQPNPMHQPNTPQGINQFTISAPPGAAPACFTLCESDSLSTPNAINSVTYHGESIYTLTLARPITPYAVTRLAYRPEIGPVDIGTFLSHPGNVNGDGMAGPIDILALIDCLNSVNATTNCPWSLYSADIDQSGAATPADILRLIDLLNGVYDCSITPDCPWIGPLPSGSCDP